MAAERQPERSGQRRAGAAMEPGGRRGRAAEEAPRPEEEEVDPRIQVREPRPRPSRAREGRGAIRERLGAALCRRAAPCPVAVGRDLGCGAGPAPRNAGTGTGCGRRWRAVFSFCLGEAVMAAGVSPVSVPFGRLFILSRFHR